MRSIEEDSIACFGEVLRRYRESQSLTRVELASIVGLNASYVHRLEMGNRRPSRKTVIAMAVALKLDASGTNKWLIAAGHGPLPISQLPESAAEINGVDRTGSVKVTAAGWGARLEKLGLESQTLGRLSRALDTADPMERRKTAAIVSRTLLVATRGLEANLRTVVIPAAGGSYRHRRLPEYVLQRLLIRAIREATDCGIYQVILVLAPHTQEWFYLPLKEALATGSPQIELKICVQEHPKGLGDAILLTEKMVGPRAFAVILPDDFVNAAGSKRSARGQQLQYIIDCFTNVNNSSLVAVTAESIRKMPQYGIVELGSEPVMNGTRPVQKLIEKPKHTNAILRSPRAFSIVGRYILQPDIFGFLKKLQKQDLQKQNLELTTALELARESGRTIRAVPLKGTRKDFGEVINKATEFIGDSM